jgi:hypothetical protein
MSARTTAWDTSMTLCAVPDTVENMATGGMEEPAVLRLVGDVDALTQGDYRSAADEIIAATGAKALIGTRQT